MTDHITYVGKKVQTIETSKLLLECADWIERENGAYRTMICNVDPYIIAHQMKLQQWAAAIRSVIIPEPVGEKQNET